MNQELRDATNFIYRHFTHRFTENATYPNNVKLCADVTCSNCGDTNVSGVFDGRVAMNTGAFCMPCWSLMQGNADYFPGKAKDKTLTGKIKTPWIVDESGMRVFASAETVNDKRGVDTPGLVYEVHSQRAFLLDLVHGRWRPPFVAGVFSAPNKRSVIAALRVTRSLEHIVFCDAGAGGFLFYNAPRVIAAIEHLAAIANDDLVKDEAYQGWRLGDDLTGARHLSLMERRKLSRHRIEIGLMPRPGTKGVDLFDLTLAERRLVSGAILDLIGDRKGKKKKQRKEAA
ncbi:hypothetical protein [Acidihalobacter prosperus]|uniref:Uncharacterized protein n=1 Tax=Acidihalobacter prosperus TaxID=160660 RepID=A0A1A6C321_9GAMM|nr:hypothetical protein [Acidihalobacter prosperus]OBS08967.1 hypothetical protein Thpro_022084 [Acidihalobacter prosperus]